MSKAKKALETAIVRCMNVLLLGMLTRGCSLMQITPEDIARPGDRGNAPPPTGGISSLG